MVVIVVVVVVATHTLLVVICKSCGRQRRSTMSEEDGAPDPKRQRVDASAPDKKCNIVCVRDDDEDGAPERTRQTHIKDGATHDKAPVLCLTCRLWTNVFTRYFDHREGYMSWKHAKRVRQSSVGENVD